MASIGAHWDRDGEQDELCRLLGEQTRYEKGLGLEVEKSFIGYQLPVNFGWVDEADAVSRRGPVVALLRRYGGVGEPVLLVHGASAWRGTFFEPEGGLVRHLLKKKYDVWTLDWRGGKAITDLWRYKSRCTEVPPEIRLMSLDSAAGWELPRAVAKVREITTNPPALLGHCMGAAIIAQAIARGWIGQRSKSLRTTERGEIVHLDKYTAEIAPQLVLSAIGLFYRGGVDNWFRAQELFMVQPNPFFWCIDPLSSGWPGDFEPFFKTWEKLPYPHCDVSFCRRLSALIGSPYRPDDIGYLHDEDRLGTQFGVMPVSLLNHCAQNVRRGWSARVNARSREEYGDLRLDRFANLDITLITGSENQLWHRDSIDRMYEWLQRDPKIQATKVVYDRYGHQDLWWDPRSASRNGVYDKVSAALRKRKKN